MPAMLPLQTVESNTSSPLTIPTFTVDTATPALRAITKQESKRRKKFTFTIEVVHSQHDNNADLSEELFPVFIGDCRKFKVKTKWQSNTPSDGERETYTATATAPKGTYDDCELQIKDKAGNVSVTRTFDAFTIRSSDGIAHAGHFAFEEVGNFLDSVFVQGLDSHTTESQLFTRNLSIGDDSSDVRRLQVFLNDSGYTIARTGPGSPGNETTYFGELTEEALIRYQRANNITPASGYFGSATRAHINDVITGQSRSRIFAP